MKKLAIFDLDGTLLNTIADLGAACNYALGKMGFATHPISAYNYFVGNGVRRLIERAQIDADEATVDQLLVYFKEYYNEHDCDATHPYPGIPELLSELTSEGVALAVASNKYQQATTAIIRHFFPDVPFAAVLGQGDDRPVKPDPSVVFAILNIHPTPKAEVVMIGDSAVDIETARRACVDSVGVTWGFRPVSELRNACADRLVSTPAQILELIKNPGY